MIIWYRLRNSTVAMIVSDKANRRRRNNKMANLRLKKQILEVVDNQLASNDPPCTKETYEKLLAAGYSLAEAKEKIGAVLISDIYYILKDGRKFDEDKYKLCLEEMLQQCIDFEDDHHISTEWDQWEEWVEDGYDGLYNQNTSKTLEFWNKAWTLFQNIMEQEEKKYSLEEFMEKLDDQYPIDGWLQDFEMELANADQYEERITLCQKVLEMFDWNDEDDSCFLNGIAESLFSLDRVEEAFQYYENQLKESPSNADIISSYSWSLSEHGENEKAYALIKRATYGTACYADNSFLFHRAHELASSLGREEEAKWYLTQLDKYHESVRNWEMGEDEIFDEFTAPKRIPVVTEKKVYPNDPCPCGSGKKYKKCCGRNK